MGSRVRMLPIALAACAVLGAGTTARAGLVYGFGGSGAVGTSQSFGSAPNTVTIYGFDAFSDNHTSGVGLTGGTAATAHNLFLKNDGGNEIGAGLTNTNDHELTLKNGGANFANFIAIDLRSVNRFSGAALLMGSTTSGEAYDVWGGSVNNLFGTKLLNGSTTEIPNYVGLSSNGTHVYDFITITVHPDTSPGHSGGNVLVGGIILSSPEPSTMASAAMGGLVLLGLVRRRRVA